MSRRRKKDTEMPGTDSFLDVVANLVGILIILVVVIGASAATNWSEPEQQTEQLEKLAESEEKLNTVAKEAKNYERNNHELEAKINTEKVLLAAKRQQRHLMLVQLKQLDQAFAERSKELDDSSREKLELETTKKRQQQELSRIQGQIESLAANTQKVETIEHFPTPVAKTVFNKEYHFELKGGRLTLVPLDELVRLVQGELQFKAEKLRANQSPSTVETVGPIGNYRMQYLLASAIKSVPTATGMVKQRTIEFRQFILLPIRNDSGQPVSEAIGPGGELYQMAKTLDPKKSTISLWVYPDSYSEFREIKQWLHDQEFQMAVWPLPSGAPISGGPNGFRSASQ